MRPTQIILSLLLAILTVSCSNISEETEAVSKPKSTWQERVKYAQSYRVKGRKSNAIVRLVDYKHLGVIKSESDIPAIIDSLFSEETYFTLSDNTDSNVFHIEKIRDIIDAIDAVEDDPFVNLKSQLKSTMKIGMELIEIKWEYKGKNYFSTAIVSNEGKGFIYDNIGYFLPDQSSSNDNFTPKTILKSQSESSGGGSTSGNDLEKFFSKSDSRSNIFGSTLWTYSIYCASFFNKNGVLINKSMYANHNSGFGYSCDADVRTVDGTINSSKYHEFAWAYSYSPSTSVSVSWHGSGFTISGGGTGASAVMVH